MEDPVGSVPAARRRAVLGGAAAASTALLAGCVRQARNVLNRDAAEQVSLTVKTVPADVDPAATRLCHRLVDRLETVGVDASMVPMQEQELLRDVLVNQEFDVFVAPHPGGHDPDFLFPLLHSRFNEEPGWQNPYGFTDLTVDDLLVEQRHTTGERRKRVVGDLLGQLARKQPFAVVAFPDAIGAVRTDRFEGWTAGPLESPATYLSLRRADGPSGDGSAGQGADDSSDEADALHVVTTDGRATRNRNPVAAEFRDRGLFTGLLYDPLGRRLDGDVSPWLADEWEWSLDDDGLTATVRVREGATWHDGRELTARDVAFTYRFLQDTSLDRQETEVPAPRFRGRASLVADVTAVDSRTVRFSFRNRNPTVASRAFTVPVLPAHVWRSRTARTDIGRLGFGDDVTEALVWSNPEPVGSGPLAFERADPGVSLTLRRFNDHFLHRESGGALTGRFDGGVAFDRLVVHVAPSDSAAVELLEVGEATATVEPLGVDRVPSVGRASGLSLVVERSPSFYQVGFNTRRAPLGNPHFRRAVARLLDKAALADSLFDGYARPAAVPLADEAWVPADLQWTGEDPEVPFFGDDGDLDVAAAQETFRDAGYRYGNDDELLTR